MFSGGIVSDQPTVAGALVAVFGPDARVETKRSVGGGCINQTGRLTLTDGRTVFLKENSGQLTGMFQREAEGLAALAAADGPRVPQPLAYYCGDRDEGQFLLLEDLSSAPRQAHFWEEFGRALARMHGASAPRFGFHDDNYIGATVQPNTWEDGWTTFFQKHRLGFQLRLARDRGLADRSLARGVERVIDR